MLLSALLAGRAVLPLVPRIRKPFHCFPPRVRRIRQALPAPRRRRGADRAEFEHAANQPGMDRLKASTIGHPVAIIRLVLCILPLVATLAPMGKVVVSLPYFAETTTINMISIVTKVFMALDIDHMFAMVGSEMVGSAYIGYLIALVGLVFVVLATIVNIVNACISCGKNGLKRNIITAIIGIVFTVIATVGLGIWLSGVSAAVPEVFSGTLNVLGPICIALVFVLQIIYHKLFLHY